MAKLTKEIGIIIGRFQVTELHSAHLELIETVIKRHQKVILFLGQAPILNSIRCPLDMFTRKSMIQQAYPNIIISHIMDRETDEAWVKDLDCKIHEIYPLANKDNTVLYGGRDSFINHYTQFGKFSTEELEICNDVSGTENRQIAAREPLGTKDFRKGVIYSTINRYNISYQTVDIACFDYANKKVLLAKKKDSPLYRFIGGFVDTKDESLEMAARREFIEETQGEPKEMKYAGSFRINDWRYKAEKDKIMTSLFFTELMFGHLCPSDDISELEWIDFYKFTNPDFSNKIVNAHNNLYSQVVEHIISLNKENK